MSSAATWDSTLPPAAKPTKERILPLPHTRLSHGLADVKSVPRYLIRYGVLSLAILGAIQLWAARGDGPVPAFSTLSAATTLNPRQVSSGECMLRIKSATERWEGLAPALVILQNTNPEVADWVERTHMEGRLVFTDGAKDALDRVSYLAKFDLFLRELRISPGLYAEPDGSVAAILAHEYRHSRQGFPKILCHALSFFFIKGGDPSIVENDAVIYEQEARRAIFGESNEALEALTARLAER